MSAGKTAGRHVGRIGFVLLVVSLLFAGVAIVGILALTGRPIGLPVWAVAEVERRVNDALDTNLAGAGVSIGAIEVMVEADWTPRLRLEDLRFLQGQGTTLFALPDLRVAFDPAAFVTQGALLPTRLRLIGGNIALKRQLDGTLDLRFGNNGGGPPIDGLTGLLAAIDTGLQTPFLSQLKGIEAEAASLTIEDARSGRVWNVGDGRILLENRPDSLAAELGLTLVGGGAAPAQALVTMIHPKGQAQVRLTATFDRVAASDIALQAPVLAWLSVLDAPISGRIAAEISAQGVTALDAEMQIAAGALRPDQVARPIAFDGVTMRLGYDPSLGRIALTDLTVDSSSLRLKAVGQAFPLGADGAILSGPLGGRLPTAFMGQVEIREAQIDPDGLFERPLVFTKGAMDARLTLDPFRLDIGQIALIEEKGRRLSLSGKVGVQPDGWQVALDLGLDAIAHDRLLQLWPRALVKGTREWVGQNVAKGLLTDVKAALRIVPGQEPRLSLGYEFDGAEVTFLRTLPPIRDGSGRSSIEGATYTLVLDKGTVEAPIGGDIAVAGSVFTVPDILAKPPRAEIRLKTESAITAALSLLDLPPFGFMTKAGLPADLGKGRAVVDTVLSLPLVRRVELKDVDYRVSGSLLTVSSTVLIKGKTVSAEALSLQADPTGLQIFGKGTLGKVPFDVTYSQGFSAQDKGQSRIEGKIDLSPATVAEFGLGLPDGMVRGTGRADLTIALQKGAQGTLKLSSDLAGLDLSLPQIGWSKPAGGRGTLEVEATLGQPPQISRLRLQGAGLDAVGSIDLRNGGGLERARFTRVTLNDWLDAPVDLVGRQAGQAPDVVLAGGTVDLRRFDRPAGSGQGAGSGGTLRLGLDQLIVSDGIRLTGFRGDFNQRQGFSGTFQARVNGEAAVTGTVIPARNGLAVRVQSADAGATLRSAGIFSSARGGALDMQLTPRAQNGHYDGRATIRNVRVRDANVLAELLSAVSVVGMLEQLNGEGILFGDASAEFIITPQAIEISRGSAIGASLGVSMAGLYGTQTKKLALQGVISPVYLLNGIGAALTRKGEGLFGFNYALRGTSDNPQVQVNPLSILTPGMFREIFRRPAPELRRQSQ
ncbi:MAG: DUF3971 domain-containing protein [Rhodobacteraceae bacterium]|nr:DUF3971 domain-containing protein [Paracoccaceae bacterium]MCF8515880.1 DUF3971 domain-containing protein [Paracoccaceae bacterium]MCF8520113.1 DUF3971 domain-containing protein [Paracoccaceae bacterium]